MKRLLIIITTLLLLLSVLSACQTQDEFDKLQQEEANINPYDNDDIMDKGPVNGGILKLFSTVPDTLNPLMTSNAYVKDFSSLIYESLVSVDQNQKPVPVLSDRWSISSDGLMWTFHIRDNVFWQDGISFTAEDVEFTFESILNSSINSVYKGNLRNITTFAALDRKTFRIVLNKPNSFTAELLTFPIISKKQYGGVEMSKPALDIKPIGTGPYCFEEYKGGKSIRLKANRKWWQSSGKDGESTDLPHIEGIEVKIYKNSRDAINAFQARDVDIASIESVDYDKYSGRSDLIIKKYPGRNFEFITFNLANPLLSDKNLRQAIAGAIDKEKIMNNIMAGRVVSAEIPVIPGTWLYDSSPVTGMPNIPKIKENLLKNGYKEDSRGIFKIINGVRKPLNFEIVINEDNPVRSKLAAEIGIQLKTLGINTKITTLKWEEEFKRINTGKFDMVILGCRIPSIPDISFLYSSSYLPLNAAYDADMGRNIAGYDNPEAQQYMERIFNETDEARRKALFINMKSLLSDDVPYIGLYFSNNAVLYSRRVRGNINPHVWNKFNNIAEWYLPEK